jgi:hypothetical protein
MATLNVKITEDLVINGQTINGETTATYTVNDIYRRIVTATTTEQTILLFGSAVAAGQLKDGDLKYLRITNLDTANFVTIRVIADAEAYFVKLPALASWLLCDDEMEANADGAAFSSFETVSQITLDADTGSVDCEIYAATA